MTRERTTAAGVEELVSRLASDLVPVRRCWPPRRRLLVWMAGQAGIALLMGLALGLRSDLGARLRESAFAVELAILVVLSVGGAALALLAAVPGREPRQVPTLGGLGIAVASLALAYAVMAAPGPDPTLGWLCAVKTVAGASLPWIVLMIALRRGATLAPGLAGMLAGCASLAAAAAVLRVTCALDERWHLLLWHLGPVALGCAASLLVGTLLLSRWRRSAEPAGRRLE